jgi:predicted TIM-barrel fold metal-dependent hydrolase
MPLGSMRPDDFRPWLEYAVEAFGAARCMFASNFPVDSAAGSFDDLYSSFDALTSGLDEEARDALFAGTAERIYRL